MDISAFEEQLKEWNIPFAVIADLETGHAIRIGNSTELGFDDLENALFRDAETVVATGRSLHGQIMPRSWSQGKVSCVVCKPDEQTVVGLFCNDQLNPVEKYHLSKQLNAGVAEVFSRN